MCPESVPDLEPSVREGQLLAGKYRVERVLGEGGMGIVVSAVHEQLQQRVAIKFVRKEAMAHPEAISRFLREARAVAALKSEHVAKVTDVGTLESGAPYMVMEFLEGRDLGAILEERRTVPVGVAAEWVIQACEAVAEAHAKGIVHRDLKPANLFLARTVGGESAIKVLDFGVSKSVAGALTSTSAMLGSPFYMAPEQMRSSKDVTPRSDVWALGVVLFQLLAGKMPFEAASLPELCFKVASDPPLPLREFAPELPPEVFEIVNRCLEKDPARRFQDASELATALEPFAPPAASVVAERARLVTGVNVRVNAPTMIEQRSTAQTWRSADMPSKSGARAAVTPAAWDSRRTDSVLSRRTRASWIARGVGIFAAVAVAGSGLLWWRAKATGGQSAAAAVSPSGLASPSAPAAAGANVSLSPAATVAPSLAPAPSPAPSPASAPTPPPTGNAEASTSPSPITTLTPTPQAAVPAPLAPTVASTHHAEPPKTNSRPQVRPPLDDIPTMR